MPIIVKTKKQQNKKTPQIMFQVENETNVPSTYYTRLKQDTEPEMNP